MQYFVVHISIALEIHKGSTCTTEYCCTEIHRRNTCTAAAVKLYRSTLEEHMQYSRSTFRVRHAVFCSTQQPSSSLALCYRDTREEHMHNSSTALQRYTRGTETTYDTQLHPPVLVHRRGRARCEDHQEHPKSGVDSRNKHTIAWWRASQPLGRRQKTLIMCPARFHQCTY